jgi:hypothetical protein
MATTKGHQDQASPLCGFMDRRGDVGGKLIELANGLRSLLQAAHELRRKPQRFTELVSIAVPHPLRIAASEGNWECWFLHCKRQFQDATRVALADNRNQCIRGADELEPPRLSGSAEFVGSSLPEALYGTSVESRRRNPRLETLSELLWRQAFLGLLQYREVNGSPVGMIFEALESATEDHDIIQTEKLTCYTPYKSDQFG